MAYIESYEQLTFAIVKLAVEDYRSALKRLKRHRMTSRHYGVKLIANDSSGMILEHIVIWMEKGL